MIRRNSCLNNYFSFLFLQKLQTTSNASRSITKIKTTINLIKKPSVLFYRNSGTRGRHTNGRILCWTKSSVKRLVRQPRLLNSYRYKSVGFVTNLLIVPFLNKLIGLVYFLTGTLAFLQLASKVGNFSFLYHKTSNPQLQSLFSNPIFFKLHQLKTMAKVSFLSALPSKQIQYIKSSGSYGVLIHLNMLNHTGVVKLPSGIKKIFSIYTLATLGPVGLGLKKKLTNTKAGFWKSFGLKSIVRGVARNPIDHPHGGRTKSIKYPRTPWGKTTKFK